MSKPDEDLYRVKIIADSLGGTPAAIKAWAPEEMSFSVESTWDAPFESAGSSIATAAAALGFSVQTKAQSTQVWKGTTPIQITMPFRFFAESQETADADIINPMMNLMKLAVPDLKHNATFLDPPGPIIPSVKNALVNVSGGKINKGDQISIEIGRFLRFPNVIISAVNVTIPLKMTADHVPLTSTVEVTFRTFNIVTKPDLEVIFNRRS